MLPLQNIWSHYRTYVDFDIKCCHYKGAIRSHHETCVDFDKICVFCDKCCIRNDKYVFIGVKIKCMNYGRINSICDKVNFTTNYTYVTTSDNIISKYTQLLQFCPQNI